MLTRWGETLDKQQVLQEYPRPQLVRESYYNLNGLWDYAITASDACPGAWDGLILDFQGSLYLEKDTPPPLLRGPSCTLSTVTKK